MGTSSPHPGSNGRSPLVPPHADAEPDKPLPEPKPQRFRQFRTDMGHFVQSGDKADLNRSLKSYTQQACGGADIGPRKFGTAITAGGALIAALSSLSSGQAPANLNDAETLQYAKLQDAIGQPLDVAIETLADALAPIGEESDKIRDALIHALSESLEGVDEESFAPETLNEEIYAQTLVCFIAEIVFQDIVLESGAAFDKVSSAQIIEEREDELRTMILVAVDNKLSNYMDEELSNLSMSDIKDIQLSALKDVFSEWDGLD